MNASIEIAMELEDLFERPLATPVDVLDGAEEVRDTEPAPEAPEMDPNDAVIISVMSRAGFQVHPTVRSPFKAVSENERGPVHVLTGHSKYTEAAEKRARLMASIGRVARTRSVYFVDEAKSESIDGTAIVSHEEVEASDVDELRLLIRERSDPVEEHA